MTCLASFGPATQRFGGLSSTCLKDVRERVALDTQLSTREPVHVRKVAGKPNRITPMRQSNRSLLKKHPPQAMDRERGTWEDEATCESNETKPSTQATAVTRRKMDAVDGCQSESTYHFILVKSANPGNPLPSSRIGV